MTVNIYGALYYIRAGIILVYMFKKVKVQASWSSDIRAKSKNSALQQQAKRLLKI